MLCAASHPSKEIINSVPREKVYGQRDNCTAISKRLKFYAEIIHTSVPITLCRKSLFQFPQNWGKYSATNIGQIAVYLFILEKWKRLRDGCVINSSLRPMIGAITGMDKSECLSMQSSPVSPLARLFVGPRDHSRLGPDYGKSSGP